MFVDALAARDCGDVCVRYRVREDAARDELEDSRVENLYPCEHQRHTVAVNLAAFSLRLMLVFNLALCGTIQLTSHSISKLAPFGASAFAASNFDASPRFLFLSGAGRTAGVIGRGIAAEAGDETIAHADDAVALARRVRAQHECGERARAPVRFERGIEVDVGGDLAVDDDEGAAFQKCARVVERAARAEDRRLVDVVEAHAEAREIGRAS